MLFGILLSLEVIVSVALVGVILLQRSEGGALGVGGGPSGFMTARGAGNLLTRTTGVLAFMFFVLAVGLTILGNFNRSAALRVGDPKATIDPSARVKTTPAGFPIKTPTPVDVRTGVPANVLPNAAPVSTSQPAAGKAAKPGVDPLANVAPVTAPASNKP
jgi:preprotein translocase subunit SecG